MLFPLFGLLFWGMRNQHETENSPQLPTWVLPCIPHLPLNFKAYRADLLVSFARWTATRNALRSVRLTGFEAYLGPNPSKDDLSHLLAELEKCAVSMIGNSSVIPGYTTNSRVGRARAILVGEQQTTLPQLQELQIIFQVLLARARAARSRSPQGEQFRIDIEKAAAHVQISGTPALLRCIVTLPPRINLPLNPQEISEAHPILAQIGKVGTPPVRHALEHFNRPR